MVCCEEENGSSVMRVILHKKAEKEAIAEFKKYAGVSAQLASMFRDELDAKVEAISSDPFLCHNRGGGIFSVRLKVFPFNVFYKVKIDHIRVLAILH